jgi:hypothetical protein
VEGLLRPSPTWPTTCGEEAGVEVLPFITLPTTLQDPADPAQQFVLPVTMLCVQGYPRLPLPVRLATAPVSAVLRLFSLPS